MTTWVWLIKLRAVKAVNIETVHFKFYSYNFPLGLVSVCSSRCLHRGRHDAFIVAPLVESLALAPELNQVLKQDLDMLDLDVLKFNCFFPGDQINDDNHAHALVQNTLQANLQLTCLSSMDAGISPTGLRAAGVERERETVSIT